MAACASSRRTRFGLLDSWHLTKNLIYQRLSHPAIVFVRGLSTPRKKEGKCRQ